MRSIAAISGPTCRLSQVAPASVARALPGILLLFHARMLEKEKDCRMTMSGVRWLAVVSAGSKVEEVLEKFSERLVTLVGSRYPPIHLVCDARAHDDMLLPQVTRKLSNDDHLNLLDPNTFGADGERRGMLI